MFSYLKAVGKMVTSLFANDEHCFACPIDCDHEDVVAAKAAKNKPFGERMRFWHPELLTSRIRYLASRRRRRAGLEPISSEDSEKATEAFVLALCSYYDGKPATAETLLLESCRRAGTIKIH